MADVSNTVTYGEVRRRELFHAMLVAWVLGLALMWRWWEPEPDATAQCWRAALMRDPCLPRSSKKTEVCRPLQPTN
jgi:hypothetical protein